MTKNAQYIVSVVFTAFIGFFAILFFILPKQNFSPKEKRYLKSFPEISFQSLTDGTAETGFEDYINDHMPLRDVFMGVNSYSNLLMLNNGGDGVYKCRGGYLINEPASNDRLSLNLSVVSDFANKTGIDTTLMVVPSTGYIMEENLPPVHKEYRDDEYYAEIKGFCRDNGLEYTDLRNAFKAAAGNTQLYYKTDHHWTTQGAYLAYRELSGQWGNGCKGKDSFTVEKHGGFYGTTYNTSALWLNQGDAIEIWNSKKSRLTCEITANGKTSRYNSVYFRKNLETADKYTVFLNGNNPVTTIENPNKGEGEKLLIIKDSFSHCLAPFLAEDFSRVTLVDMRYYKKSVSEEICGDTKYDKVLVCYGVDNFLRDRDLAFLE